MNVRTAAGLCAAFLAVAAASGIMAQRDGQDPQAKLVVDGRERTYQIHVPSSYTGSQSVPLVLSLHGRLGTGAGQQRLTHMDRISDAHGFLVVYPDGLDRSWADGRGGSPSDRNGINDIKFLSTLIDRLEHEYKVDASRVCATGMSNGGFMTGRLACELSDRIAAVAIVAASLSDNVAASCHPARPVSVLVLQGTNDPLVPFQGGALGKNGSRGHILSHEATVQKWLALDQCKDTERLDSSATESATSAAYSSITMHTGCAAGTEVEDYVVVNGGHTWPGGQQYLPQAIIGQTARDRDASEVIWEFFSRHPLGPSAQN